MARASKPAAPRVGSFDSYFVGLLDHLKAQYNISPWVLANVLGLSFTLLKDALSGVGPATFRIRSDIARIVAMAGCPRDRVFLEPHVLPPVDPAMTIADLERLAEIAKSPFASRWVESRLRKLRWLQEQIETETATDPVEETAAQL